MKKEQHRESKTKLYGVWSGMKARCSRESQIGYEYYGGRGIVVCDEWRASFIAFRDWAMANGYEEGLTLERLDVDGNYEPSNCKWITQAEQAVNTRKNIPLTAFGETKPLLHWSNDSRCVVGRTTLYKRVSLGWEHEEALITPPSPGQIPGEDHPFSKLNPEDIKTIFAISKLGFSQTEISRMFSVSRKNIGKILNRETWKHVDVDVL